MANITTHDAQFAAPVRALSDASIRVAKVPMVRVITAPFGTSGLQETSAQPAVVGIAADLGATYTSQLVSEVAGVTGSGVTASIAVRDAAVAKNTNGITDPGRSTWSPPV